MWCTLIFLMVAQVQSMPMTQEEKDTLDKFMFHIIEQMKTEFVSKTEFIPVKKVVTDHLTIIEEWNPMLIHHDNEIQKIVTITEQLKNLTKAPGPAGATGEKGNPGAKGNPGQPGTSGLPGAKG